MILRFFSAAEVGKRDCFRSITSLGHILPFFFASICLALTPLPYHKVKFVYDGDTILLASGEKVRYLGIDAPEIDHTGGNSEFMASAARDFNIELVNRTQVRLEFDQEKRDRYGRLLSHVFLKNGKMVNAMVVRKGLAHVMLKSQDFKYKDLFLDCQRKAMKDRLGIWSRPFKHQEEFYSGNKNFFRFHRPSCPFGSRILARNLIRFDTRHDAFWEGYSPCKRCRP
ncbi:MAG: thermonuclease family protein [Thermodesulfobacteriota bacterium]|nr:thermonuclease family protein [Thermodesulfobacteriota bacterium]